MVKRGTMVICFCVGLTVCLALPAWADFLSGMRAYEKHDYATALREFKADSSAQANYLLGIMYYKGEGVESNKKEAVKWLQKAAVRGHVQAAYSLAVIYDKGDGIPQDQQEAVKWYRKAAEKGHALSQFNLGLMYTNGEGVEKNHTEAVKWLRKAARQKNVNAQKLLRVMGEKP